MISIAHKLPSFDEQQPLQITSTDVDKLVGQYQEKDGYSHHRLLTLPESSQQVLLTFWHSKKHYRQALK